MLRETRGQVLSRTSGMRAARKVVTGKTRQIVVLVNPVQVAAACNNSTVERCSIRFRGYGVRCESSGIEK